MIEPYLQAFSKLHSDRSPSRWQANTNYRAPHKPLLLLAIMDLIAQRVITRNFIELQADLIDAFDLYWRKVIGTEKESSPVLPFFHLKSEGFWHLIPVPEYTHLLAAIPRVRTYRELRQCILGARFDDELFALLTERTSRDELRRVIIESYFAPQVRSTLVEVSQVASETLQYSQELIGRSKGSFKLREVPDVDAQYQSEVRSSAFRRVVVQAYNHRCAICGIRVITPEGRTAVAAAHIVPWSYSHNDDPRNGMALCGLHHWTFDQGIVGVGQNYEILVSPVITPDDESAGPLLLLAESKLHQPIGDMLRPAKKALEWHFDNVFLSQRPKSLLSL